MKKIKRILVEGQGFFDDSEGEIKGFEVGGEMANVIWYRQNNKEFNGKYVIEIDYYEELEVEV